MYKNIFTIDKDNIVIAYKSVGIDCQLGTNDFELPENKPEILGAVFDATNKTFTHADTGVVVYAY